MPRPSSVLLVAVSVLAACLWAGCAGGGKPNEEASLTPPDPYVGSPACAECHADLFQKQSASHHALTLRASDPQWEAEKIPPDLRLVDRETKLEYGFAARGGQRVQTVSENGREVASAPVQYLLGSGHHGVSLVTHDASPGKTAAEAGWRYLSLTYYAKHGWDFSPMHLVGNAEARRGHAAGWPVSTEDLKRCFGCHATRLEMSDQGLDPARTELGVRCESCHGPGRAHVEAARAREPDLQIQNPGRWKTKSFMALCQQCHNETSTLDGVISGISDDPTDPRTVKYHVYGLQQSRCFTQSNGALRCTTCHDPHGNAEPSAAAYEAHCRSCHTDSHVSACPVNPRDGCLGCHMPKVQVEKYTHFADHWIRARSPFAPRTPRAEKQAK